MASQRPARRAHDPRHSPRHSPLHTPRTPHTPIVRTRAIERVRTEHLLLVLGLAMALVWSVRVAGADEPPAPAPPGAGAAAAAAAAESPSASDPIYGFEARRLGGEVEKLDRYRGRVLLIVNTASRCGYTPQYEGLQALYEENESRGLTVLGFPSNDFGNQEPGSNRQIGEFCKANYGVDFPMFSKVHVNGPEAHPLYRHLTSQPAPVGGPVGWNFQKYLVDRSGHVVMRFDSRVRPDDPKLVAELDRLLDQRASAPSPRPAEPAPTLFAAARASASFTPPPAR